MSQYAVCQSQIQDAGGNALPGATVHVYQPGTTTPVAGTLYSDNALTQTLTNPLTSDAYGGILFYMALGQYVDFAVSLPGYATRTLSDRLVGPDFPPLGTSGYVLTSNGPSLPPTYQASATTNGLMVFRYDYVHTLTLSSSTAVYTDFGGSFTTSVTIVSGDILEIDVQGIISTGTSAVGAVLVDIGGTKYPGATDTSSVFSNIDITGYVPFQLHTVVSGLAAGTYTVKPQMYNTGAGTVLVGGGNECQYSVKQWR